MNSNNINFMNQKSTPDNVENNEFTMNSEESDYQNLINRLQEIKTTISWLEKTILR